MYTREQRQVATLLQGIRYLTGIPCREISVGELKLHTSVLLTDRKLVMVRRGCITIIDRLHNTVSIECRGGPTFVRTFDEIPQCVWIEVNQSGEDV